MKFFLILLFLFVFAGLFLASNHDLSITESHDRHDFVVFYVAWLDESLLHVRSLTGAFVSVDWLPD